MQRENLHAIWELPKGYIIFPTEMEYLPSSLPLHQISAFLLSKKMVIQIGDSFLLRGRSSGDTNTNYVGIYLGINGMHQTYPLPTLCHESPKNSAVFRIFLIVGEDVHDIIHHQLPHIPYTCYPSLHGVQQVVGTNFGLCVPIITVDILAYIFHVGEVESNPLLILKGAYNAFCAEKYCIF